jgi:hypothetical protein
MSRREMVIAASAATGGSNRIATDAPRAQDYGAPTFGERSRCRQPPAQAC